MSLWSDIFSSTSNVLSVREGKGAKAGDSSDRRRASGVSNVMAAVGLAMAGLSPVPASAIDTTTVGYVQQDFAVAAGEDIVPELRSIRWKDTRVEFDPPLAVDVEADEGLVSLELPVLGLSGYGDDTDSAAAMLADAVVSAWMLFVESDESELAPSGLALRSRLVDAVSLVENTGQA